MIGQFSLCVRVSTTVIGNLLGHRGPELDQFDTPLWLGLDGVSVVQRLSFPE